MNFERIKYIALSLILLLASISFVRTTLTIMESSKRLETLKYEVERLEKEKLAISEELEYQKTPEYIEQEARNRLNFVKPNEQVYVVEQNFEKELAISDVLGSSDVNDINGSKSKSNLYKWLKLVL